ncbi:MAG TPA: tol-pal system protein YbgF [Rhizomicrobium sp.]|nr:tol-pal system protein YbgF [Rhizomicrobium sp.]
MKPQSIALLAAVLLASAAPAAAVQTGVAPASDRARGVQLAGLFGESDEEKAARQHEMDQDSQISDLTRRISDLERALQQTTGQNEQLSQRIRELSARIDQQQKDFDYKLCTLAAQQLGTGTTASSNGLPCDSGASSAPAPTTGGAPPASAPPQSGGTLGTLPQAAAPDASVRSQYDEAMNLLARARYDEARAAFQSFVDANPKDPLAAQATYWVGNIAFVQKDYAAASQAFAQEIKNYPTSAQGPESTLKLGQSLIALGKKKEGCVFLGAIKTKYKHAPDTILAQAAAAHAASCK